MAKTKHSFRDQLRARPGASDPVEYPADATPGAPGKKNRTIDETAAAGPMLADLQEKLFAEATAGGVRRVLLVLQGMDTSGKGGVIEHVVGQLGPAGTTIASFKKPTPEELAHHFLWRIRRRLPVAGMVGVFDRSHYEDVLVVKVHSMIDDTECRRRYEEINAFEAGLAASGTTIVKCFLNISYDEQRSRLLARLDDPSKHWKFREGDIDERGKWSEYMAAYAGVLANTSTDVAPWYVIPADRKWYRNWAISEILRETMADLDPKYPATDLDVDRLVARLLPPQLTRWQWPFRGRLVTLVLCSAAGEVYGATEPVAVESAYWSRVDDVVAAARRRLGLEIVVLRLLCVDQDEPHVVTYLAEIAGRPRTALAEWPTDPLREHPLRLPYARPGGPARELEWARQALGGQGIALVDRPEQMRTWNLSTIWRLATDHGRVWLKTVPPFLRRESKILAALPAGVAPRVLAADAGRLLLADVPGEDQYQARGDVLGEMIRRLIDVQAGWIGQADRLMAMDAEDWRLASLAARIEPMLDRCRAQLTGGEAVGIDALVADLPDRLAQVADSRLPETLVHGDFHRGNVRGAAGGGYVLLDWGEFGVGHPVFDLCVFGQQMEPDDRRLARDAWISAWRRRRPGCRPERAVEPFAPVAELISAVIFQDFLDRIEPDERVYHATDPVMCLRAALAVA